MVEMRIPITAGHDEVFAADCEFTFPDELDFDVPGKLTSPPYVRKDKAPGDTSDGWHTFDELYEHRTILFASLCNCHQIWNIPLDVTFRSWKHHDGTMYDGMFIAGILTDSGWVTYHCEAKFWDYFCYVPELDRAPEWDGATPEDGLGRLKERFCNPWR